MLAGIDNNSTEQPKHTVQFKFPILSTFAFKWRVQSAFFSAFDTYNQARSVLMSGSNLFAINPQPSDTSAKTGIPMDATQEYLVVVLSNYTSSIDGNGAEFMVACTP